MYVSPIVWLQTDKQTNKQTDKQTNKQTNKHLLQHFVFVLRDMSWKCQNSEMHLGCTIIIWRSVDRASWQIFIIKPTRWTNFSNLFRMKLYMFRTVPPSIIRIFFCTHSNGICHTVLLTACELTASFHPDPDPDDGRSNCPKHVEFHSK